MNCFCHGGVKSGSIITIDGDGVLQIDGTKIVSTAAKNTWNKAATDATNALTEISKTIANVSNAVTRVSNLDTRTTTLEGKMIYITSADIGALVEQTKG